MAAAALCSSSGSTTAAEWMPRPAADNNNNPARRIASAGGRPPGRLTSALRIPANELSRCAIDWHWPAPMPVKSRPPIIQTDRAPLQKRRTSRAAHGPLCAPRAQSKPTARLDSLYNSLLTPIGRACAARPPARRPSARPGRDSSEMPRLVVVVVVVVLLARSARAPRA